MSDLVEVAKVDERLNQIVNALDKHPKYANEQVPGLSPLLKSVVDDRVYLSKDEYTKGLLKVFKNSKDQTYERELAKLTPLEQHEIEQFVAGKKTTRDINDEVTTLPSKGVRSELWKMAQATHSKIHEIRENAWTGFTSWFKHPVDPKKLDLGPLSASPDLRIYSDATFQNWGRTVESIPSLTFVPKTVKDIQSIVKFAKQKGKRVRCAGYRHTWSPSFSDNGQILISMLEIKKAETLPDTESLCKVSAPSELEKIEFMDKGFDANNKRLVRIGCAATNERFHQWCNSEGMVSLPLNVIMVEITFGGSNAPICHGAGREHQTLSDLVRGIEYVDAHGQMHTITKDDKEFLKAASGCFGLIGVVTHITLEVDKMRAALMRPKKLPAYLAIPPPLEMPYSQIPVNLRSRAPETAAEAELQKVQREAAQREFEIRAHNEFYSEWFWFPYSDFVWVNTWSVTDDLDGCKEYPNTVKKVRQWLETFAGNVMQNATVLEKLYEITGVQQTATTLMSRYAMYSSDEVSYKDPSIKTYLPNALHFHRGIQNMRVMDIEVEMPLPPTNTSKSDAPMPDYTIAQRAWWDAILKAYEPKHAYACPQRMPLEMRIMGGSNVVMAPQRGNLATCSIEVLTPYAQRDLWHAYAQEMVNVWTNKERYVDATTGERLKVRPHWAKQWHEFQVDGKPWLRKLRDEDYKEEITEFKEKLSGLGKRDGWTLEDVKERFGNKMFDELILSDVGKTAKEVSAINNVQVVGKAGVVSPTATVSEVK